MPWKDIMSTNKCEVCNKFITKRAKRFCSGTCYNVGTKTKGITGYKSCINCLNKFPFRDTLKVRSRYSKKLGCFIGSINQRFCSFPCSVKYRNKFENPAQTESGRKKISDFAKSRGTAFLHTPEAKEKMRNTIKGKGHWNWQNGKTSENRKLRNSLEVKIWRKQVFERDIYTCVQCGIKNGQGKTVVLHADHIQPWATYPELRFDINNGRTLCVPCHKKTDTWGGVRKHHRLIS